MAYRDPAVGRARDLERYHRRTAQRRAQGLCPRCGKRPPEPERSVCEPCAEKHRVSGRVSDAKRRARGRKRRRNPEKARACERRRYRRKTAERIAAGLCPACGKAPPEPERRLCSECAEKKRAGDRRRYAEAKASGALYGGKSAERRRRNGRAGSKRRYHERREAGLCVRCGERPPADGSPSCEECRASRNAHERARWDARRATGLCGSCGDPAPDGASRCPSCAALQAGRPSRRAYARKMYARRRARNLCTDCGQPSMGASRCPPCARRSYVRSGEHRGLPAWPARFTVIEIDTGECHGSFDSEAEVAACLVFARLTPDQVEIVSDTSAMTRYAAWE